MLDADLDRGRLRLFDHEGYRHHGMIIRNLIVRVSVYGTVPTVLILPRAVARKPNGYRMNGEPSKNASSITTCAVGQPTENPRKTVLQRAATSCSVPQ